MLFSTLLFYFFSFVLLSSALAVVLSRNTIHSLLFLILAFINTSMLFILLGAEFLSLVIIIVYVGAIAVLFIFTVMMINIDKEKIKKKFYNNMFLSVSVFTVLAVEIILIIKLTLNNSENYTLDPKFPINENIPNIESIGNILYTDFVYPFQISAVILFVSMIGAIVLTNRNRNLLIKKQSISSQINRNKDNSIKIMKVKPGQNLNI